MPVAAFGEQQLIQPIQPIHHLHRIRHLLLLSARVRSFLLAALLPPLLASLVAPHFSALRAAHAALTVALPPLQTWIDLTPTGGRLRAPPGTYAGPTVISRAIMHSVDASGAGIALKESGTTLVEGNEIIHRAVGLMSDSPTHPINRITVIDNRIAHNFTGISFYGERGGHLILRNRFEHNLWPALVGESGQVDHNEWRGNYWDNYQGFDRNGDGVGDSAHEIWAYADQLWIEMPMAKFFSNSPLLELLDFLERLAPFSSPKLVLRDPQPQAHRQQ
jgi:hypothetical protein